MKLVDLKGRELKLKMTGPDIVKEVPFIKTIENYKYNGYERAWYVPATRRNIDLLTAMKWRFIGDAYTEILRPNEVQPRALVDYTLDPALELPMGISPYQVEAVVEIQKRHNRAVLAFPPGTGKTLIGISWLQTLPKGYTLIVCPAFLKNHWQRELYQWTGTQSEVLSGRDPDYVPNCKVIIINYDILTYWVSKLAGNFNTIIFDESHALINRSSLRTKAASLLSDKAKHVLFMTGTPIKSRPLQFWPVLNIIDRHMFKSEDYFKNRYCAPALDRGIQLVFKGGSNEEELHWLSKHYVVHKTKEELLPFLPPKNRVIYTLNVGDKKLQQMEKDAMEATGLDRNARLMELSHTAYFYKKEFLYDMIEEIMDDTGKCIVGAYHLDVIADLKERFPEGVIISGKVAPDKRQGLVDAFQKDNKGLILAQIQAAGLGFTLDTCHDTVFAEMVWTPGEMTQFEDRSHRRGSKATQINYYYTVVADTIEESMIRSLDKKAEHASQILSGKKESFFQGSAKEDIDIK